MILIIGGAGYVGSHLNQLFHKKNYETIVLDNLTHGHSELVQWGRLIEGDMGDPAVISKIFDQYPIELVVHHANPPLTRSERSERYYSGHILSITRLLNAMLDHKKFTTRNLIFTSTSEVYGIPKELPVSEEHPTEPIQPYGDSQLMVENILEDYRESHGLNCIILRCFHIAGADPSARIGESHEPETHLIPSILDAALGQKKHVKIFGTDYDTPDGTCIRDYIHVNDLAEAHILAYERLLKSGGSDCFNVCSGIGHSVQEVIDTARKVIDADFKSVSSPRRRGDAVSLVGDPTKIKTRLGWKPKNSDLVNIIKTAWKWQKKLREI